jgi:hypothetical protein
MKAWFEFNVGAIDFLLEAFESTGEAPIVRWLSGRRVVILAGRAGFLKKGKRRGEFAGVHLTAAAAGAGGNA